ncbi:hypothetical protein RHO12_00260 [Orbus sturtevantii]
MSNKALIFILSSAGLIGTLISGMIIYSLFLTSSQIEQMGLYYLLALG